MTKDTLDDEMKLFREVLFEQVQSFDDIFGESMQISLLDLVIRFVENSFDANSDLLVQFGLIGISVELIRLDEMRRS